MVTEGTHLNLVKYFDDAAQSSSLVGSATRVPEYTSNTTLALPPVLLETGSTESAIRPRTPPSTTKRVARDREEKSRGSDVSKTFGVVVCEPRVVRRAFAFVRVDGRSGAVFEKRLYRERDVERDR